jgi:hypothetical protein
MVDNIEVTPGVGKTVAADEISTTFYQRIKLVHGIDGVNDGDVSRANGFPVSGSRYANVEALVEKAHGFFTATHQDLTLVNVTTSTTLVYWNNTDGDIYLSWDGGTTNHEILPAKSTGALPIEEGATAVWAKYSTDPTEGTCYFGVKK